MTDTQSIQIVERQALPAISIRTTTPRAEISRTFERVIPRLWDHLTAHGAVASGPLFACYYMATPDTFDVEIGFPLSSEIAGSGDILMSELPGGRMVSMLHVGPYHELPAAWDAFVARINEESIPTGGPCIEIYITDPGEEPDMSKWETELLAPVAGS